MTERCYCGDPDCYFCGSLMGTYREKPETSTDEYYERDRQEELEP